ncbi:MAG: asparagine synthase (glutamine-hydrolyzing) [Parvularculaceae bacterium]|nr:asparagine synthase (glutamine-hydrolyzing) [Parvularculaceae bacterium]
MCGIAGIVDLKGEREIDRDALARMTAALKHRGPDGEGFFYAPGVGFGHRRLAIIDVEGGAQPFVTADRRAALTYNGEIYNHQSLARALADEGVSFRTRSDTEALAYGLAREGVGFLPKLRGMFAFGFWDPATQSLLLARDRLGERPLYYVETRDGFLVFASEIGAIAASGLVALEIDAQALADYFLYGFTPDPKSIWRGVRKLPPATALHCRRGERARLEVWWRPNFMPGPARSLDEAAEELRTLLDDAVRAQMISDVPLGAFLSGGVDSAAIVSSMAASGGAVRTCTIGFDSAGHDERAAAAETAAHLGTVHSEDMADLDQAGLVDEIARVFGEPFADSSALPSWLVAKLARRHVTVALSGDGGDELFAGYRRHALYEREERVRRAAPRAIAQPMFAAAGALYPKLDWAPRPLRLKTTLQSLGEDAATAYAHAVAANLPGRVARMLSPEFRKSLEGYDAADVVADPIRAAADDAHPLEIALRADLAAWLPSRMLVKVDRASMAHGLEVRPPLLDHILVEWACRLGPGLKLERGESKRALRAAIAPRVPAGVLARKKRGFDPPVSQWMRAQGGPAERLATSRRWRDSGVLDAAAVDEMLVRHRAGVSDCGQELWTVVMYDAFLAQTPRRGAPF